MHAEGFLHKLVAPVMHKKRFETFKLLIQTTLINKKLSLTELGREMKLPIKERSAIRRADRFLGNKKLHAEREAIFTMIAINMIGNNLRPDILVDWSSIPNTTHHTLRAALVTTGRALTLYEEVHPEKKLGNKKVQKKFLHKLKSLIPEKCRPIIITDGGFHNDWFKEIVTLDWNYIGRIRGGSGKKYLQNDGKWKTSASLMKKATRTPTYCGKVQLGRNNPTHTFFYLYKEKRKKRKELTQAGKKRRGSNSHYYRETAREPWLLASSLCKGYSIPKRVVKKYKARMQIEEGFRDLKSSRYGFGFENAFSKKIKRIEILLLISTLASYIAWLTGWAAEKMNIHYQFQSNTVKTRRVLSLFFLGCRVIKKKIEISVAMLEAAVEAIPSYAI